MAWAGVVLTDAATGGSPVSQLGNPRLVTARPDAAIPLLHWIRSQDVDTVVVAARGGHRRTIARTLNIVTGALPDLRLAATQSAFTDIAPLVALDGELRVTETPTEAFAAVQLFTRHVPTGVWVRSLRRLDAPHPSFGQSVRALVPGAGAWIGERAPAGRVVRAASRPTLTGLPPGSTILFTGAPDHPAAADLRAAAGGAAAYPLQLEGVGTDRSIAQYVAVPARRPRLSAHAGCPSCLLPVFDHACPFCHVVPSRKVVRS